MLPTQKGLIQSLLLTAVRMLSIQSQPHFWGRLGSISISRRTSQSSTLCPCSIGGTKCHPAKSCASDRTRPILTQARSQRVITLPSPSSGAFHSLRTPYCSPIAECSLSRNKPLAATFSTSCFDDKCTGTSPAIPSLSVRHLKQPISALLFISRLRR